MPSCLVLVVCTLGLTIATFCPTSALVSVDLPALGAPTIATTPQCAVICPVAPALRWRPRSRPPASSRLPPKPVRDPLSPLLPRNRSEEHTSELQSLMRISYAVFCLKQKTTRDQQTHEK